MKLTRVELIIGEHRGKIAYSMRPLYPEQVELLHTWFTTSNPQRLAEGRALWNNFKEGKLVGVYRPKGQPVQYAIRMKAEVLL